MQINKKDYQYQDIDWVDEPVKIGNIGGRDLYYLGKDKIERDNLVATYYSDEYPLNPVALGDLLKWSQDPIYIDEQHEKMLLMSVG